MSIPSILIIDDEKKLLGLLARIIKAEGFEVVEAMDLKEGQKQLSANVVDVVLCDVKLPDGNGVDFVASVKPKYPDTEFILLTAYGNIADGVQAMKNGAFDYITKGDDNDRIIPLVNSALSKVQLARRVKQLEQQAGKRYSFQSIIGNSMVIKEAVSLAEKVAPTDASVLLLGETGTGKEVFAQAIHHSSKRNGKPFLALNCSAFGKELLESEIFGHKVGSFTGAVKDKKGLLEEASTGTLFLDEIGEMHLDLQAKLLRVLETGEFIKVGDTRSTKVNVRVIAATNRDLEHEVKKGYFREDLFYRLNVFIISLPPLRERSKDIVLLAEHFMKIFAGKANRRISGMNEDFLQRLQAHPWKGNIRELKNVIERAVILAPGEELTAEGLPFEMQSYHTTSPNQQLSAFDLASVEKLHIQRVLNFTKGNKTETARLLNIGLTTLYRKIEEYKVT